MAGEWRKDAAQGFATWRRAEFNATDDALRTTFRPLMENTPWARALGAEAAGNARWWAAVDGVSVALVDSTAGQRSAQRDPLDASKPADLNKTMLAYWQTTSGVIGEEFSSIRSAWKTRSETLLTAAGDLSKDFGSAERTEDGTLLTAARSSCASQDLELRSSTRFPKPRLSAFPETTSERVFPVFPRLFESSLNG
jgi:hypothetical protein